MFGEDVLILSISWPSPTLTASPRACAHGQLQDRRSRRWPRSPVVCIKLDGGRRWKVGARSSRVRPGAGTGHVRTDAAMNAHASSAWVYVLSGAAAFELGPGACNLFFFLIVKIMAARSGINNSGEKSVILEKGLACDDIMQPVCGRALSWEGRGAHPESSACRRH